MRIVHDELLAQLLRRAGRDVEVFCDGIKQAGVISADEEKGEVVRLGERGEACVAHETLKGRVQIEIVRRAP